MWRILKVTLAYSFLRGQLPSTSPPVPSNVASHLFAALSILAYRRPSDFAFAEAIEDIASTVRAGRVGVHLTVSRLEARRKRKTTATPASSTSEGGSNNDTAEAVVAAAAAATAAEALAEREGVALCMSNGLAKGRLTARRLREVLESGGRPPISEHDVYLCGPPAFITSLRQQLAEQGVPRSRVFFEQWW
jgi:ferredoxin-NADP reductase